MRRLKSLFLPVSAIVLSTSFADNSASFNDLPFERRESFSSSDQHVGLWPDSATHWADVPKSLGDFNAWKQWGQKSATVEAVQSRIARDFPHHLEDFFVSSPKFDEFNKDIEQKSRRYDISETMKDFNKKRDNSNMGATKMPSFEASESTSSFSPSFGLDEHEQINHSQKNSPSKNDVAFYGLYRNPIEKEIRTREYDFSQEFDSAGPPDYRDELVSYNKDLVRPRKHPNKKMLKRQRSSVHPSVRVSAKLPEDKQNEFFSSFPSFHEFKKLINEQSPKLTAEKPTFQSEFANSAVDGHTDESDNEGINFFATQFKPDEVGELEEEQTPFMSHLTSGERKITGFPDPSFMNPLTDSFPRNVKFSQIRNQDRGKVLILKNKRRPNHRTKEEQFERRLFTDNHSSNVDQSFEELQTSKNRPALKSTKFSPPNNTRQRHQNPRNNRPFYDEQISPLPKFFRGRKQGHELQFDFEGGQPNFVSFSSEFQDGFKGNGPRFDEDLNNFKDRPLAKKENLLKEDSAPVYKRRNIRRPIKNTKQKTRPIYGGKMLQDTKGRPSLKEIENAGDHLIKDRYNEFGDEYHKRDHGISVDKEFKVNDGGQKNFKYEKINYRKPISKKFNRNDPNSGHENTGGTFGGLEAYSGGYSSDQPNDFLDAFYERDANTPLEGEDEFPKMDMDEDEMPDHLERRKQNDFLGDDDDDDDGYYIPNISQDQEDMETDRSVSIANGRRQKQNHVEHRRENRQNYSDKFEISDPQGQVEREISLKEKNAGKRFGRHYDRSNNWMPVFMNVDRET